MRILRFLLPSCLLLIGASVAFADSTPPDPKITMGGSGSCQSFDETALTQEFDNVNIGCLVDFTNDITINNEQSMLELLVVNVDTAFTGTLSCAIAPFIPGALPGPSPLDTATLSSPTSCTFTGGLIEFGSTYSLEFDNDPGGNGTFASPLDITLAQTVIPSPEPSTLLLAALGLALLAVAKAKL